MGKPSRITDPTLASLLGSFTQLPFQPGTEIDSSAIAADYGARTVRLLPEIDEAEGAMVVEWLARRLPAGAVG